MLNLLFIISHYIVGLYMSLLYLKSITEDVILGVWAMDEYPNTDFSVVPETEQVGLLSMCPSRQRERVAVYALLREMTGNVAKPLQHEPSGRPFIDGFNIGISHTKGYAAVILSKYRRVSVDIEYISDRVVGIASRFLCNDELISMGIDEYDKCSYNAKRLLLAWCAKETVYKFYSDERLTFGNMVVSGLLDIGDRSAFYCKNALNDQVLQILFDYNDKFAITYTYK